MLELRHIRRIELISVAIIVILLTGWRLYMEVMHYNSMLTMDQNAQYGSLISYNFFLNTVFPVIARTVLLFAAWYLFHFLVCPKLTAGELKDKDILYITLVLFFSVAGIFLYYYFKVFVSTVINYNTITAIKTESLYRKQTIFLDTAGMLIIFGIYELLSQLFYYLHQQLSKEKELFFKFLTYFLLACLIIFLIIVSILIPTGPLWQGYTSNFLFTGGLVMQIYLLQHYFYQQVIPSIQTKHFPRFSIHILMCSVLVSAGTFIIWSCYVKFRWRYFEPLFVPVFIIVVFCFFSAGVIAYIRHFLFREKTVLQTQVSASSAELNSLRSQINPHFLFNALNSLYATALKEKSDKTADGIQKLGDMMRFMLEENNQERIPLDKEIEYLHNYIDIQRMRIDESQGVEIRINIHQPEKEIYLAPMMLNPFVENAFKHGVSLQHPSWIYITLTLDATRLYFKVHNSLHAKSADDPEENSSGVGLANVKKRLELLYPGKHILDIQQSDKDYFVSLTLTYETKNI
jgi:two-component system, LytTR family, sensor kinase